MSAARGWDRAGFRCGRCDYPIESADPVEFARQVAEHRAQCQGRPRP
ncbi:hypothetical protein [Actinacidiphila sp. bgisy160]